jgi:hypothetical protein
MSICEFKNSLNVIINFVAIVNEETMPNNMKKIMVKIYANTLGINLTDRMIDSFIEITAVCA